MGNRSQEAVMAKEHTTSKSLVSIVGAVVVALGLVILFGKLDGPASRLMTNLLAIAARTALEVLPSLVQAAWQAVQAYAFDYQRFSPCPLELLATLWPVLHGMAGLA
jgi:hypothetical protein